MYVNPALSVRLTLRFPLDVRVLYSCLCRYSYLENKLICAIFLDSIHMFFSNFKKINLFLVVALYGFSLVAASWGYSLLPCTVFSLWWLLLSQSTGSRHASFTSCGILAP